MEMSISVRLHRLDNSRILSSQELIISK